MTETSGDYIENAVIMKTRLGYEGHGRVTALITLDLNPDDVQAFGGLNLADGDEMKKFITSVIDAVGTGCWESLPGLPVRIKHRGGPLGKIIGIGHVVQERWYIPEEYMKEKTSW